VETLLSLEADASAKSRLGQTAFEFAQYNYGLIDTEAYWLLNDARF
jgi:hypothetical protein